MIPAIATYVMDSVEEDQRSQPTQEVVHHSLPLTFAPSVASSIPTFIITLSQVIDKSYINNITCSLCNSAVCEPVGLVISLVIFSKTKP